MATTCFGDEVGGDGTDLLLASSLLLSQAHCPTECLFSTRIGI